MASDRIFRGRHHVPRPLRPVRAAAGHLRWAPVAVACVLLTGCGGTGQDSTATLARLAGLEIAGLPMTAKLLVNATDVGGDASGTATQPAIQRVYSTSMSVEQATRYYLATFGGYGLTQTAATGGSRILNGGLYRDSVVVTISAGHPQLQERPRTNVASDGSATYITVFAEAGRAQ